jgi:hypothetical protein
LSDVPKPPEQQMKEALRAHRGTLLTDQSLQRVPHLVRTFFGIMLPAIAVPMEAEMEGTIDTLFSAYGGQQTYQILAEWLQILDLEELVSNLEVIVAELLLEPVPATFQPPPPPPPPPVNCDSSSPLVSSCPMDAVVSAINTTDSSESSITTSIDTQSSTSSLVSSLVGQHIAENDSLSRSTDTTSDSTTESSQSQLLPQ